MADGRPARSRNVGRSTARAVGNVAAGDKPRSNPQTAVVAVTLAGGLLFWDLARSNRRYSEQQKLHTGVAFGVGAVILVGLAEAVPELGVPLAVLLLLVVAVGRPGAIKGLQMLISTVNPAAPGAVTTEPLPANAGRVGAPIGFIGSKPIGSNTVDPQDPGKGSISGTALPGQG